MLLSLIAIAWNYSSVLQYKFMRLPAYIRYGLLLNQHIRAQKIANAGHFPFVEKPKEVCRLIKAFLFSLKTS